LKNLSPNERSLFTKSGDLPLAKRMLIQLRQGTIRTMRLNRTKAKRSVAVKPSQSSAEFPTP